MRYWSCPIVFACATLVAAGVAAGRAKTDPTRFVFDSSTTPAEPATVVKADDVYTDERGWGYERLDGAAAGALLFSVKLDEGNYAVTVVLGDPDGESNTTVKAEQRRLMLEAVKTAKGEVIRRTFVVNVRTPRIAGGDGTVRLNEREVRSLTWDDKLTLEFSGPRPRVREVRIEPARDVVTVYLAGDSTVTDQAGEPYVGWGQMLPRFFSDRAPSTGSAPTCFSAVGRLRQFDKERRTGYAR